MESVEGGARGCGNADEALSVHMRCLNACNATSASYSMILSFNLIDKEWVYLGSLAMRKYGS